ncbi:hypothetical protein Tco_0163894 [Tanacetum coccineum]
MESCTNKKKPLVLPWGRTPRLDSGVRNEETWNTNKFSDVAQFPMGPSPDMRVLGHNTWADYASDSVISMNATSANLEKRQTNTCSVSDEMDIHDSSNETTNSPRAKK